MRISTATAFYAPVESMLRQQAEIERTQKEIATGQRLTELMENPAQAAQVSDLDRFLAANERFGVNATMVSNRLRLGEVTLNSVIDVMQRVRELAVQAGNDSLDAGGRKIIAHEVRDLSEQLLSLANRKGESGEYLFAGTRTNAVPFLVSQSGQVSYVGDSREREVAIGLSRTLSDGFAGDNVFMEVTAGNGSFLTRVDMGNSGSGTIDTGRVLNGSAWQASATDGPFTISFEVSGGQTRYSVTRSDGTFIVPAGTAYRSGQPIEFAGIAVTVNGAPADGDDFTVVPATGADATESIFKTLDRLSAALEIDTTPSSARAKVTSEVGALLLQLDQALDNLGDARSSIGTRLRMIDESESFREEQTIMVKETLSTLRDVDFAEALARLNAQMTALQVAQQAYAKISSRTLFDYL
jgi:flagellar hook-associated protein 3 FlgL